MSTYSPDIAVVAAASFLIIALKAAVIKRKLKVILFAVIAYILEFAEKVKDGRINLEEIQKLPEEEAQKALISLKGIGPWTAEMILLFGMQKPDILSYGDLAILRGMRMV